MKNIYLVMLLVTVLLSCNTSRIVHVWKAADMPMNKYQKIMVTGLIRDTDRSTRQKMEEHFAGDLRALGYMAVSALTTLGPRAFADMDEQEMLLQLKKSGVDAVLTIVLLNKTIERSYGPTRPYQDRFWGYYGRYNRRITGKDYYVVNTKYFWETNFYEMEEGQLLYSVQTRSFDPASTESMGHEYGKMIVQDMLDRKVLQNVNKKATE